MIVDSLGRLAEEDILAAVDDSAAEKAKVFSCLPASTKPA
jgi:hypothetical protein